MRQTRINVSLPTKFKLAALIFCFNKKNVNYAHFCQKFKTNFRKRCNIFGNFTHVKVKTFYLKNIYFFFPKPPRTSGSQIFLDYTR